MWAAAIAAAIGCGPSAGTVAGTETEPESETVAGTEAETGESEGADETEPAPHAEPASRPAVLVAHNRFRTRHCAPALAWSGPLAREAQAWADALASRGCAFQHDSRTRHGENLAFFGPAGSMDGEDVAAMWYREVEQYDFARGRFSMETGHFTQLAWVGTRRLGCGSVRCGGGELWVCRYDPPGNVEGRYRTNVLPASCGD